MEFGFIIFCLALMGFLILRIIISKRKSAIMVLPNKYNKEEHLRKLELIRLYVVIFISATILVSALYIILFGTQSSESQNWAFGSIGTILGYWLKDTNNSSSEHT